MSLTDRTSPPAPGERVMSENHPDKGKLNGRCNRTACQRPGATWFNTSTRAYYCAACARDITRFTKRADGFHICFPTLGSADLDRGRKFGAEEPASLTGSEANTDRRSDAELGPGTHPPLPPPLPKSEGQDQ